MYNKQKVMINILKVFKYSFFCKYFSIDTYIYLQSQIFTVIKNILSPSCKRGANLPAWQIAETEGLSVRFMGPAENTKDIYWRYNGFIMPSKFEGFGLTAYEAMASGLPLFLSDIDAFKSMIKDNALYFSLSDAAAAAERIRDVVYGKTDTSQITENAKQYARQNVRRDIYIKKLLTIYDDVVKNNITNKNG